MWSTRTLSPRQIYGVQAICLGTKTCERPATKPLALKNELCSVIDKTYFLSSSLNQAQTTGNDDNVATKMASKQAKNKPIGLFTYHFKATWQVNDILFRVHRLFSWWVTRSLSTFCKNPQLLWQHIFSFAPSSSSTSSPRTAERRATSTTRLPPTSSTRSGGELPRASARNLAWSRYGTLVPRVGLVTTHCIF